jgi:hypothetical protein
MLKEGGGKKEKGMEKMEKRVGPLAGSVFLCSGLGDGLRRVAKG